jgi:site-specific recombinase XerD
MLELYFSRSIDLRKLRRGPLAPALDQWAAALHQQGYSRRYAVTSLVQAGAFNRHLYRLGVTDLTLINVALVQQYLETECYPYGSYTLSTVVLRQCLAFLRKQRLIPPEPTVTQTDPISCLIDRYATYLTTIRGVASSTLSASLRAAKRFLAFYAERDAEMNLSQLTAQIVLDFLTHWYAIRPGNGAKEHLAQYLRAFLRFLRGENIIAQELERVIMVPRRYALATVPHHLPWSQVEQLLACVDLTEPAGRRDRAILSLLAYLGLRACEVRQLTLGDIDWRNGTLHISASKTQRGRVLPLLTEVGEVLADYILHERYANSPSPHVFLCGDAPHQPVASSSSIGDIVHKHLKRLDVPVPAGGAHLLRHSFATHLVNQGTSIKEIADLLGHGDINSTAIYTKVDTTHLQEAALPFPTGGLA